MSVAIQQASLSTPASPFDPSAFARSRRYSSTSTVGSILADLQKLREFDSFQEGRNRTWIGAIVLGFILLPIGFACLVMEQPIYGVGIGGIGLVTIVTGFIVLTIRSGLDLDNRRYELVAGILGLLQKDMAADQPIVLNIDFREHNHKDKFVRSGKVGRWDAKFYRDRWLELQGRFLDGSKYSVAVIQKHQDRSRTKRSASGKTKFKSKTKSSTEAIVSIKFKEKRYPTKPPNDLELLKSVKLPDWVELKSINGEGNLLTIRATTTRDWQSRMGGPDKITYDGVHWLAMMFMNLYQQLNRSRQ